MIELLILVFSEAGLMIENLAKETQVFTLRPMEITKI